MSRAPGNESLSEGWIIQQGDCTLLVKRPKRRRASKPEGNGMNLRLSIVLFAAACSACSQNGVPQQQNSSQSGAAAPAVDRSAGSGSSGSAAPGAQAATSPSSGAAPAESKPQFKEVTIPSGTTMAVKLANSVASETSKVEDAVRGTLTKALVVDGTTVAPAGSEVDGT